MSEQRPPILSFRGVTKRFGGTLAVHDVDLDIRPGDVHALLGANGAGKSTLIKLLAGVHEPDGGAIYYLRGAVDQRIDHMRPRPPMAFIHQDLGLVPTLIGHTLFAAAHLTVAPPLPADAVTEVGADGRARFTQHVWPAAPKPASEVPEVLMGQLQSLF